MQRTAAARLPAHAGSGLPARGPRADEIFFAYDRDGVRTLIAGLLVQTKAPTSASR